MLALLLWVALAPCAPARAATATLVLAQPANPDAFDGNDEFRKELLASTASDWYALKSKLEYLIVVEKGYLGSADVKRLAADLDEAADKVPRLIGRKSAYSKRLTVYVYGDGPMSEAGVPGAFSGEKGLMLKFAKEDRAPTFHELAHVMAGGGDASQSLAEGLADWVQAKARPGKAYTFVPANADPDALAKAAIAKYPSAFYEAIGAAGWGGWSGQEVRQQFYFASWSFVKYLIKRNGMAAFLGVFDAKPGSLAPAYAQSYGKDLAALRKEWRDSL
jgi:hypothetical protein